MKEIADAPKTDIVKSNHAPDSGGLGAEAADAADAAMNAATDDCTVRRYAPEQVVCVECEHVREMRGETDEVVRRTRSEASENAVLNAVMAGGVEPDWFVERWIETEREKVLVACAVFEDKGKCAGFRKAVNDFAERLRKRGDAVPVRLRSDAALEAAVARHFTEEWSRRRKEQMAKYRDVIADAKLSGEYAGRVVVGEYVADGDDAKRAFGEMSERLNAWYPHDAFGEGGIAYSGFWDRGNVARFCFGFPCCADMMAVRDLMDGMGARFWDPFCEGLGAVETEMAALVIAKMQGEAKARASREELAKGLDAAKAAAEKGNPDASELID